MQAIVHDANTKKECAGNKAMRHHLHHAAFERERSALITVTGIHDAEHDEKSERYETHMGDRRIGDQFLHIPLHQRNKADVNHRG